MVTVHTTRLADKHFSSIKFSTRTGYQNTESKLTLKNLIYSILVGCLDIGMFVL